MTTARIAVTRRVGIQFLSSRNAKFGRAMSTENRFQVLAAPKQLQRSATQRIQANERVGKIKNARQVAAEGYASESMRVVASHLPTPPLRSKNGCLRA